MELRPRVGASPGQRDDRKAASDMTTTAFDVRRVGGRIGAEIIGVDIAGNLDAGVVSEINAALLEHRALLFRGQRLDDDAQLRFASLFGELTAGRPRPLPSVGELGVQANHWHGDATFLRTPPRVTTLRSVVVPPYGGSTLIANAAAAYRDLPWPLRRLADELWAVHTNEHHFAELPGPRTKRAAEQRRQAASRTHRSAHPVVRVHPETGERGLFIGGFAQHVVGLAADESRDILRILQSYVTRPENVVSFNWAPGDLVVFDNRITQHYAPDDYGDLPRVLHRVAVAGDVPAGIDGERSSVVDGDDALHYSSAAA
jgi:alpha-ketoglutarate-dependent taurine dioxygenase